MPEACLGGAAGRGLQRWGGAAAKWPPRQELLHTRAAPTCTARPQSPWEPVASSCCCCAAESLPLPRAGPGKRRLPSRLSLRQLQEKQELPCGWCVCVCGSSSGPWGAEMLAWPSATRLAPWLRYRALLLLLLLVPQAWGRSAAGQALDQLDSSQGPEGKGSARRAAPSTQGGRVDSLLDARAGGVGEGGTLSGLSSPHSRSLLFRLPQMHIARGQGNGTVPAGRSPPP